MEALKKFQQPHRLRRTLITLALVAVGIWLTFFDSHSLLRRLIWHQEHARLAQENEMLRKEIEAVEARLDESVSNEVIERIAREQYGMRRPGETVYRVE